jgi:pimeloyl-ACP methyl ester carboxylesterase
MIIECASLTWAQKGLRSPLGSLLARLSNRPMFVRQFARLFSPAHPLSRAEAEDQWALWRYGDGARIAHRLTHYLDERRMHAARWHGAIREWPGSLRFAWGMRDPVATPRVLARLRELRPSAPVTELPDLGHYPQLERPRNSPTTVDLTAPGLRPGSASRDLRRRDRLPHNRGARPGLVAALARSLGRSVASRRSIGRG